MTRIASRRPENTEVGTEYQQGLIDQVEGECILRVLEDQLYWICELASHCLLYTSPSPRDLSTSRMPSSA